jgi:hypothetical protein
MPVQTPTPEYPYFSPYTPVQYGPTGIQSFAAPHPQYAPTVLTDPMLEQDAWVSGIIEHISNAHDAYAYSNTIPDMHGTPYQHQPYQHL